LLSRTVSFGELSRIVGLDERSSMISFGRYCEFSRRVSLLS